MANNYALIERTLREIRDLLIREPNDENGKKGFNNMGRIERTLREIRDEIESGSGGGGVLPSGGEDGYILTKHKTEGGYGEGAPIEEDPDNPGKDKLYSSMYFLPKDMGYDQLYEIFHEVVSYVSDGGKVYETMYKYDNQYIETIKIYEYDIIFGDDIESNILMIEFYHKDQTMDVGIYRDYVYSEYSMENMSAKVKGIDGFTVTVDKGWNIVDEINYETFTITAHAISEVPIILYENLPDDYAVYIGHENKLSSLTPLISAGTPFPTLDPVESESWDDYEEKLIPEGGTQGQFLKKGINGNVWGDLPAIPDTKLYRHVIQTFFPIEITVSFVDSNPNAIVDPTDFLNKINTYIGIGVESSNYKIVYAPYGLSAFDLTQTKVMGVTRNDLQVTPARPSKRDSQLYGGDIRFAICIDSEDAGSSSIITGQIIMYSAIGVSSEPEWTDTVTEI